MEAEGLEGVEEAGARGEECMEEGEEQEEEEAEEAGAEVPGAAQIRRWRSCEFSLASSSFWCAACLWPMGS